MKRILLILAAVGAASAGFALQSLKAKEAISARRHLTGELSATLGRARQLDAISQQWNAERGEAKSAEALVKEALARAPTPEERQVYEALAACLAKPGCPRKPALEAVDAHYAKAIAPAWAQADALEKDGKDVFWIALFLVLAGPVIALALAVTSSKPKPPAPVEPAVQSPPDLPL